MRRKHGALSEEPELEECPVTAAHQIGFSDGRGKEEREPFIPGAATQIFSHGQRIRR